MKKRKKSSNRMGMIGIILVVLVFCCVILIRTKDLREKNEQLEVRQSELQEKLEAESQRSLDLEERRVYVQTKKYVEDVAKQLGLVYPDEVIFKPED